MTVHQELFPLPVVIIVPIANLDIILRCLQPLVVLPVLLEPFRRLEAQAAILALLVLIVQ